MDYNQLHTFITVSKLKKITKCAELLNVTLPTVTGRINNLENELNCKLFYRDGKQLSLTEEGMNILPLAEKAIMHMQMAKQSVAQSKQPEIKIGLSPAFSPKFVSEILSILQSQYEISITIDQGSLSSDMSNKVLHGEVDLALVRSIVPFPEISFEHLYEDRLVFIVGKKHNLSGKTIIEKDDLNGQTLICNTRGSPHMKIVEEKLLGVHLNIVEVGNFEIVKSMVRSGYGFSIIPALSNLTEADTLAELSAIPFAELEDVVLNVLSVYKETSPNIENIKIINRIIRNLIQVTAAE